MNNTVCRNFNYNEKADGTLELINLNCDKCEFDGHCDIKTAYQKPKVYAVSMEFVVNKGDEEFHCGVEESGFHAYNCNDCPNKCEEWYQWDKED